VERAQPGPFRIVPGSDPARAARAGPGTGGGCPIPDLPRRGRATLGLLLTTLVLPLAFLALGLWQSSRGADDRMELEEERDRAIKVVSLLEARPAPAPGRIDPGTRFQRNGRTYVGELAIAEARDARDDLEGALALSRYREILPPAVILGGGLLAALSAAALLGAAILGRAGRRSREALLRGFLVARRLLPPLLGAQVVLAALVVTAAVGFEAMAIPMVGDVSSGTLKLLGIAVVAVGLCLWGAVQAVLQLRRALDLFTPDPMPIQGRPVSPAEAPGLWRLVDELAARLGALRPDNVVVGLTGGFFVASGPKVVEPGGAPLPGRTLYLPLPLLPLLREDEVATIIGHELAHFSGGDTEYSLRFLPIYAGVGRSLDAVATAGMGGDGSISPMMRPALRLGLFVMDQFHHAVRHWSRQREFAADAAGAGATSAEAAARALLRTGAAMPGVQAVLGAAFEAPDSAPPDLVAAVHGRALEYGLDDPLTHLEEDQPHPTDTHPPTRQRIAALGLAPEGALLAEAAETPAADALARLDALFADPGALCRAASDDFLALARAEARAGHAALEAAASGVAEEELALHANTRGGGITLIVLGAGLAVLGAAVAALGLPGLGREEGWIVAGTGLAVGAVFAVAGQVAIRRGRRPFLVLRPEAMAIPGLSAPIPWGQVVDLDMTAHRTGIVTRLLLPPEAVFPTRLPGARAVKLDPKRGIITLTTGLAKGMKAQDLFDLFARYRQAELARRLLAEEGRGRDPGNGTGQ